MLRTVARPVRGPAGRVARLPVRGLEGLIHAVKNEMVDKLERSEQRLAHLEDTVAVGQESLADQVALQSTTLRKVEMELDRASEVIERMAVDAGTTVPPAPAPQVPTARLHELTGTSVADFDGPTCTFLNWVQAHNGPLAEAGLWLNHPTVLEWDDGNVTLNAVNERIVEHPFVFGAVGQLPPGARILDIGGGESTVAFSLASLGYDVTVIEPQGYPFQHPRLTVSTRPLEEYTTDEPFDAAILLSAIEHFGVGHYAGGPEPRPDADVEAVARVIELLAPGGRLVLTTPYGPAAINDLERTYDRAGIERLLDGWDLQTVAVARRTDRRTWEREANELIEPLGGGRVVMVVATPADRTGAADRDGSQP
jgi:SAM-dependent methyltransferase